jgi:acyl-CoA dehydrogenase
MEVLLKHGTLEQQQRYLVPLLEGKIRSCFLMTEPDVSSSDALNIQSRLTKVSRTAEHGTAEVKYVLNGRKWWSTGAMDPRCEVALVLAKLEHSTSSSATLAQQHQQHTVVIVPMKSPGVSLVSQRKNHNALFFSS